MNRRFRFLAALLALVAFSAYFAEGVLAAFCAPDAAQHAAMVMDTHHAHEGHAHEGHAHGPAAQEAPAEGSHQSHCPFAMGGGVTCVAVSLPGSAVAMEPPLASSEGAFAPQQVSIPLLLVHSLYHPPRA